MIFRALPVLFSVILCSTAFGQSSEKKTPAQPATLFTVNRKPVTGDEFIYLYRKNNPSEADFNAAKVEEYLNLYINFKLKVEEARSRGLDTTAAFRREYNQYRDELRKPYMRGSDISDSLVRITYERMKEEVRASHILLMLKADATPQDTASAYSRIMDIRARVLKGEDFAKLASELSEDQSARVNQGDLGYFTALQMVYPFEEAAYRTPVGSVSMPVRTRFGYHILKVADRRPSQGEVEVSHIMIRTGEMRTVEDGKNAIFNIYDQLQAGEKWEELCATYSEDLSSKDKGGRLSRFGTGAMASVPEFERVAFELETPGSVSDPFQTQYGWHILRLEEKYPLAPYVEIAPSLKTRVARDERFQISQQLMKERERKSLGFTENEALKQKVLALADTTLKTGRWNPSWSSLEVLASIGDRMISVSDFLRYARSNQRPNSLPPLAYLDNLYNSFIDEQVAVVQEQKIAAVNPEYGYLLNEYYEGILLFEIMEKEVWNKASDDSVGQYRYYEQNASRYTAGDRVYATFYTGASKDVLSDVKKILQSGEESKLQDLTSSKKVRTETGYFEKKEKAVLSDIPWAPGIYEAQHSGTFYLVRIREVLAAGTMSFAEARVNLISDYQNYLEAQWVARLRKKYPVKVNKKGKDAVMAELVRKPKT